MDGVRAGTATPAVVFSKRDWVVVTGVFLLMATALMWNVWTLSPSHATTCPCSDTSWAVWVIEWPWQALQHALNPWYSRAMFHPQGTNLLTYPGYSAIGVALLPVTALFGPVASFNVAVLLGPVASGVAATWLTARWVRSRVMCMFAGAFYAFSPLVILNEPLGHLNQTVLVVPPLVVAGLYELFWVRRHRATRVGVALGLLLTLQFFISTEVLVLIVISSIAGVLLLGGMSFWSHGSEVRVAVRESAPGVLAAILTTGVLLAGPALFALYGPSHYSGVVWPGESLSTASIKDFFVPTSGYNLWWQHPTYSYLQPSYLAPGLLLVLLLGTIAYRRDRRLMCMGVLSVLCGWLALGEWYVFAPWHWLHGLSVLSSVVNIRFSFAMFLFVGVSLAIIGDHLLQRRNAAQGRVLAALLVVVSSFAYVTNAVDAAPYSASRVWIPLWYQNEAPRLPAGQVVLGFPFFNTTANFLSVQALEGMHYNVVGGTSPQWIAQRQGPAEPGYRDIWNAASVAARPVLPTQASPTEKANVLSALRFWGVNWIVIPRVNGPNTSPVARDPLTLALWMSSIVGPVHVHSNAWVWHLDHGRPRSTVY